MIFDEWLDSIHKRIYRGIAETLKSRHNLIKSL